MRRFSPPHANLRARSCPQEADTEAGKEVSTTHAILSAVGEQAQSCLLPSDFTVDSGRQYNLESGRCLSLNKSFSCN